MGVRWYLRLLQTLQQLQGQALNIIFITRLS